MTDDTNTAPTLRGGDGPNRNLLVPTPDVPPLSTDPLPPISFSEAESHKAELFANEEWRTRYFAGNIEATRQYNQIVQGLTTPAAAPTDEREAILQELRRHAQISAEVAEEVLSGRASTPADVQEALDAKQHFFNDAEWMTRYENGGRREHAQIAAINLILSRRVRDDPYQP